MEYSKIKDTCMRCGDVAPLLIAGPCSAETESQVLQTAFALADEGCEIFRAGLWKPRTRPGHFEGVGEVGVRWLEKVKALTGMAVATEVATAEHVECCARAGVDIMWIGARTSGNPFSMKEIAAELRNVSPETIVLVKTPLSPDVEVWIGAMERLYLSGLENIGAIHRGVADFSPSVYRNPPHWEIAFQLKKEFPELPVIIDPSHMAGCRHLIPGIIKEAISLGFNGFMIESHITPNKALTDATQQLPPAALATLFPLTTRLRVGAGAG